MIETSSLPAWTTHVIDFAFEGGNAEQQEELAEDMERAGVHLGGLRIMRIGSAVALDDEAIAALRRQPEDADGCVDDEMQCWIGGTPWAVEPATSYADGTWRIGSYA